MLVLVLSAAAYEPIPEALAVSVSGVGLDRLGSAVAGVMPESYSIGAIGGSFVCDESDPTAQLTFDISGLDVLIHVDQIELSTRTGALDVAFYGAIDSTATTLTATGSCPPLTELAETCGVQLGTTPLEAHFSLSLALVDGVADATVTDLSVELGAIGNPVSDCTVASAIGTLLGQNPLALTALLQDAIDPSLADLGPSLESSLEDALAGLVLDTSLSVGAGEVTLALEPTALELDEDGLILVMGGTVAPTVVSDCVAAGEAPTAGSSMPILDGTGPGNLDYDAALVLAKPFVDQVLYGVYEGGGLCIDAGALGGLTLDTSLFGGVFGSEWEALFPEPQAVSLLIQPVAPPTIRFEEDGAPLRLDLNGLGLHAYSELDGRAARVFAIAMEGEVGLDVALEGGVLTPSLQLDPAALDMQEAHHEYLSAGYAQGLATLLPTILGSVLPDDLLPTFALPTWQGIGVEGLWLLPASGGEWLGGWITLDTANPEPLLLAGCEGGSLGCDGEGPEFDVESALGCEGEGGGCDDPLGCDSGSGSGCEGGCNTLPARPVMFGAVMLGALWRRRR